MEERKQYVTKSSLVEAVLLPGDTYKVFLDNGIVEFLSKSQFEAKYDPVLEMMELTSEDFSGPLPEIPLDEQILAQSNPADQPGPESAPSVAEPDGDKPAEEMGSSQEPGDPSGVSA